MDNNTEKNQGLGIHFDKWTRLAAEGEVARLRDVEKRLGSTVYAQDLGETVASNMVVYKFTQKSDTAIARICSGVLSFLIPLYNDIQDNPELIDAYQKGILKELKDRRLEVGNMEASDVSLAKFKNKGFGDK